MLLFEWTKSKEDIKVRHRPGGESKEVDYLGRSIRNKAYELMRALGRKEQSNFGL